MLWYVYLLRLRNDCIYVGSTDDLERRLSEHMGGTGSETTYEPRPVELLHSESYADRSVALRREQQLKGWSRAKKLALIASKVPELRILAKSREVAERSSAKE